MIKRFEMQNDGTAKLLSFNPLNGQLTCVLQGKLESSEQCLDYFLSRNLVGEEDVYIQNPILDSCYSAPFKIYIDITDSCQLNCKHCLTKKLNNGHELSLEKLKDIADECAELGVFYVKLGGGEPLLHKHFEAVVEYFRKSGVFVSVSTNGYLINEHSAKFLAKHNVKTTVSVEGTKTIDEMIRGKGHFEIALKALKCLKENGVDVALRVTLTRYILNVDCILELIQIAKDNEVPLKVSYCRPAGSSIDNDCIIKDSDYDEYRSVISFLNEEKKYYPILLDEGMMYSQPKELEWILYKGRICGAANRSMHINSCGNISPCVFMGDEYIEKDSCYQRGDIALFWREQKGTRFRIIRQVETPSKCVDCCRKCKCECLATRLYFSGSFQGEDPNCLMRKGDSNHDKFFVTCS